MDTRKLTTAMILGASAVGLGGSPASATTWGPSQWSNNGCDYAATAWNDGEAGAQVWEANGERDCSGGWVELHYRDTKGNDRVSTVTRGWPWSGGPYATSLAESNGTLRYACISARSASAGNWSTVRVLGPAPGPCGRP